MDKGYVLSRGDAGARRLSVLNATMWPTSRALLRRAGLRRGMTFLDVGCGGGDLTQRVAALGVNASGMDIDPGFVARAREAAPEVRFECGDVGSLAQLGERFDVTYARYLLSHLPDPAAGLRAMIAATRPGGAVAVEDIDFDLHVAHPRPPAFDRYLELYREVVRRRGGDATLGRHLYRMAQEAGLQSPEPSLQTRILSRGEGKRISSLTLAGIREAVVSAGLASATDVDTLLEELNALERDPGSFVSVAGTYQVWGRVAR